MLVLSFSVEERLAPLKIIFQILDSCLHVHGSHFHATLCTQLSSNTVTPPQEKAQIAFDFGLDILLGHSTYSFPFDLGEMSRSLYISEACCLKDSIQCHELADSQR